MSKSKEIGRLGEQMVAEYLKKQGYIITRQNYIGKYGEIDIIAEDNEYIVFTEVKTREEGSPISPAGAVSNSKKRKIVLCAKEFLSKLRREASYRIDVAEVIYKVDENGQFSASLNYIRNAFSEEVLREYKPFFDLHSDIPLCVLNGKKSAVTFPKQIGCQVQTASFFVREGLKNPFAYYKKMHARFLDAISHPINHLSADKSYILSVEGGGAVEGDIERIINLKADGISSLMLTWNGDNSLAGGAFGIGRLTEKGKTAITLLNEQRMALDLSHLNDKSLMEAGERAEFLLASHSNARGVTDHPRNLSDDALKLIKDKKGIVGINFYPPFLGIGDVFEQIYRHIEYMLKKGLQNAVAIGSDFDGAKMHKNLFCTDDVLPLYSFLDGRFKDQILLNKIFYQNAADFYQKLFDNQQDM